MLKVSRINSIDLFDLFILASQQSIEHNTNVQALKN